jgi:quinol monooxygenase YgiN
MARLAHHVFFTLRDGAAANVDQLIAACQKYLTDHDGVIDFSVGRREEGLSRPVNDTEFHVSLHVVFRDRDAHDAYQSSPRHLEFVAEQKDHWKAARVFDSLLVD